MAKTRISMDETKAICRYFNYLKRKYKINNSQLYNHCPDGPNQGGLTCCKGMSLARGSAAAPLEQDKSPQVGTV